MRSRRSAYANVAVAVALGMLVLSASAQALTPQFVFKNTSGTDVAVLKATISANQIGTGTLSIPGLNVKINCENFSVQNGVINTATDAEIKLLYKGCTALEEAAPSGELSGCDLVVNHTGANSHHITASALLLPAERLLPEGPAILAEKIEATVLTKEGQGCILPKTTKIKGELCLLIQGNEFVTPELSASQTSECKERPTLESLSEGFGSGVKDKLLFGIQEAFVTARVAVSLSGEHLGYSLGVLLK